eukprot:TRINITY_DN7493_c0_g3_i1.p1 TRINITY_DN7493_c0_g3~~TRINITY_DN7493_c0_g3_i1.p1  ORF type:complete len:719 (-),score=309.68 TRINITY_DN7493_c0_g3_i1:189-2294(-)
MMHGSPDLRTVETILTTLLPYSTHDAATSVGTAALDAASVLIQIVPHVARHNPSMSLLKLIVESLCANLHGALKEPKTDASERLLVSHYYSLTEWLLNVPSLLDDERLVALLFSVVQAGILSPPRPVVPKPAPTPTPATPDAEKKSKKPSKAIALPVADASASSDVPDKKALTVKDAARFLLLHLLNFVHNYPALPGVEFSCSTVGELDEPDNEESEASVPHYVFNREIVFSLVEVADPRPSNLNGRMARIFLRDASGKYVWNCKLEPTPAASEPETAAIVPLVDPSNPRCGPEPDPPPGPSLPRSPGSVPWFESSIDMARLDQAASLLQFLGETSEAGPLNRPTMLPQQFLQSVMNMQGTFLTQSADDGNVLQDKLTNPVGSEVYAVRPAEEVLPLRLFNMRLLLASLGYLDPDFRLLQMIDNTKLYQLRIKNLDKTSIREPVKLGLVYVANGQDTQAELLFNDTSSALYQEFASGLGWLVDLNTHKGYNGGLDPKGGCGTTCLYFATPTMEVAYHEVVRMPTNRDDPQQLTKKRHVGNDRVHIVWCENGIDYSPKTIVSKFNDAHIVVYPLSNGLFRIQIAKKQRVPPFGPLQHGMCVSKSLLPILVRQTAINADRVMRYNTDGYERPLFARQALIAEIVAKCAKPHDYEQLVTPLLLSATNTKAGASSGGVGEYKPINEAVQDARFQSPHGPIPQAPR